jgi:PadR family transcriptional regulator PadR
MTDREVRLTQPALKVFRFLLAPPREGRSGAEISKATKLGSGTLYPMLARFETVGWLNSEWEMIDPSEAGRPRRRFYKLSAAGYRNAHAALSDLQITAGEVAWTF